MATFSRWIIVSSAVLVSVCVGRDAHCASWELRTDDTEVRIGVMDDQPVLERLAAVGADRDWFDAPAAMQLMQRVWIDGRETPLAWKFQEGALDQASGQLTLSFLSASPGLALRSSLASSLRSRTC